MVDNLIRLIGFLNNDSVDVLYSASGSHMDRAGVIRDESDRDSASNRALLGTSLSGSLCGSAVAGPSGLYNR